MSVKCLAAGLVFASVVSGTVAAQAPAVLGLRLAIGEALEASPRLRAVAEAREAATIRAGQADARFSLKATPGVSVGSDPLGNPQRSLSLGVTRQLPTGGAVQLNATSYQYGDGATLRDSGYTLTFAQPLLKGFGAAATAERAQAHRAVSAADRAILDARQQLVLATAEAYWHVLRQRRNVHHATQARDRAEALVVTSRARSKAGIATELDVARAELLSAQAEGVLSRAVEQVDEALDALKGLLGRPLESPLDIEDHDLSDAALADMGLGPTPLPSLVDRDPDPLTPLTVLALGRRLDLVEARERVDAARRAETVAAWNVLPDVTVSATYTQRGLGNSTDPFLPLLNGWRFSIGSSYGFDRSASHASLAGASLAVRSALGDLDDLERQVRLAVRRAYRDWVRTGSAVDLQARSVALAEKQLELARLRYERGVASNFDVVDAENALVQSQGSHELARVERALAGLQLQRVCGLVDPREFQR